MNEISAVELTPQQTEVTTAGQTLFLAGRAGSGKTTALQARLLHLLASGEPAYTILVLIAEPEQRQAYLEAVQHARVGAYAELKIINYNRMAQEMGALFWPLVARAAGFAHPYQPPTFLSYDLAQMLMWQVVTPMLEGGAFADLRLRPQQIVSQLLDTLNRAALNGLSLDEAIERQQESWVGDPNHILHLQDAARAATTFRQICLDNSLLDLSLAVELFDTQLVQHPEFHKYFSERYRHLIVDNVEEQTPAGQNFIRSLMDKIETTAVSFDSGGGYKRFLSADPHGAFELRHLCQYRFHFADSFLTTPALTGLANLVQNYLQQTAAATATAGQALLHTVHGRYRREMVTHLVAYLAEQLQQDDLQPADIAIIAPYLDGALQYMLTEALKEAGLPYFLLRRRSSPREEPRIRAWLTWLALAHPDWQIAPPPFDVAEAFSLSIGGLDPARAALLTERLYRPNEIALRPVAELPPRIADRIGHDLLQLVDELRLWLQAADPELPLDRFLHRLFTQLLTQPRFQPEPDLAGAAVCDWLVQAAQRLQQSAAALNLKTLADVGITFIDGIQQGLVTANPPELGDPPDPSGIMISTIYGYLLAGEPVRVQVWLETAATGWWDIPNQPLSNTFVLAQSWDRSRLWTMEEDFKIRNELLSRIMQGLAARCTEGVVLANSDLDRRGLRQDGPLWRALQLIESL